MGGDDDTNRLEISSTDLEIWRLPHVVDIENRQIDELFTRGFSEPQALTVFGNFLRMNERFDVDSVSNQALLVGTEIDQAALGCVLGVGLLISIGAGIVAGFITKCGDDGFGTTATVAGVLTCVEALVVWIF